MRTATYAVLFFEKLDIAFAVLVLLKLAVNAVLPVLNAAAPLQNGVDVLLRNGKSRGFFVLCLGDRFYLFFHGGKVGRDFFLGGNA